MLGLGMDDAAEPMKDGFSFGEVVAILTRLYDLDPGRRDTFIGRVQQLQRMGVPRQANVGRGAKVRYRNWQLAELMVCFDLLDCAVPPATLAAYFSDKALGGGVAGIFSQGGTGWTVQQSIDNDKPDIFYLFEANALGYLRAGRSDAQPNPHDLVQATRTADTLAARLSDHPAIVLNLTERLVALREAVAQAVPERIAQIEFHPTRSAGPEV